MNFLGHAVAASWKSSHSGFVLAAMLPDLANIIGAREPKSTHPVLAAGLAYHHATDKVFHETEVFRSLQRAAQRALAQTSLRRGSRLAVAHVGVEMLLDAFLAQERESFSAYCESIGGPTDELVRHIEWESWFAALRFRQLRKAMRAAAPSWQTPLDPQRVVDRLYRALASRPSLSLRPGDTPDLYAWVCEARPEVYAQAPRLVSELRCGLGLSLERSA